MKSKKTNSFEKEHRKAVRFAKKTPTVNCQVGPGLVETMQGWPVDYVESFVGLPEDFATPPQNISAKKPQIPLD